MNPGKMAFTMGDYDRLTAEQRSLVMEWLRAHGVNPSDTDTIILEGSAGEAHGPDWTHKGDGELPRRCVTFTLHTPFPSLGATQP